MTKNQKSSRYIDKTVVYPVALSGNIKTVISDLEQSSDDVLTPEQLNFKRDYLKRFKDDAFEYSLHGIARDVLQAYEIYWRKVLLQDISSEEGNRFWFDSLSKIAISRGKKIGAFGDEEAEKLANYITQELKKEGFYSQIGRTKPHMDLLLWRQQTLSNYSVNLGDTAITVPVVMMDDFITYGWLGYATFNYKHTAGWAQKDKLYCVKSAYDINSESFKVSYLSHEGRHFADYKRFPKLGSTDLEYRAKLTELSLANSSLKNLLNKFLNEASPDKASSHAFASYKVIENLNKKLKTTLSPDSIEKIDVVSVNKAAASLLGEHSREIEKLGASAKGLFSQN
ncbi:MAG: hypothetical protein ACXVCP_02245 [Bdellovibrio sp.]